MKRLTIGLAAGVLLVLALAAVVGVGTARAASDPTKTYCLDNQTVTTADTVLQDGLDLSIAEFGGGLTSAEVTFDQTDPDAAGESGESFVDQYNDYVFGGGDDFVGVGTWTQQDIFDFLDEFYDGSFEDVTDVAAHHVAAGACASTPLRPAARFGYCSVAGNTWPNGTPIAPGTFLNLLLGQPSSDKHYTGAVPAWYVQGEGLTCSLTPAQAALAAASTLRAGGGGDLEKPIPGVPEYGFYPYVPAK